MYNKVFKNHQINLGMPYEVKVPPNLHVNRLNEIGKEEEKLKKEIEAKDPEDIKKKAEEEARQIQEVAENEARKIISDASKEAGKIARDAFDEAMKKGYEEGLKRAHEEYEDLIKEAETISEDARVQYREVLEGIESDVVEVILGVAKKVIESEISTNRDSILHIVKQAFMKCSNRDGMVLKVSPGDYDELVDKKDIFSEMVEGMGEFEIKKDASLKPGACIVETLYGCIDASTETRFRKIEEAFRNEIGKQGLKVD